MNAKSCLAQTLALLAVVVGLLVAGYAAFMFGLVVGGLGD